MGQRTEPARTPVESASKPTVAMGTKSAAGEATMEAVVARENMLRALRAVERNAGAAGVDGMTTEELRGYLIYARNGSSSRGNSWKGRSLCGGWISQSRGEGVGRSTRMGCATPRPRSSSTRWERICGKSRNCFATRISARPCAIPMSAMNRHGRRRKRSVTLWKRCGGDDSSSAQ